MKQIIKGTVVSVGQVVPYTKNDNYINITSHMHIRVRFAEVHFADYILYSHFSRHRALNANHAFLKASAMQRDDEVELIQSGCEILYFKNNTTGDEYGTKP